MGAWIEVEANGKTQAREVTIGGGHAGGALGPEHFGLGASKTAQVRVIWPDGEVSAWHQMTTNAYVTLTRNGQALIQGSY